IGRALAKPFRLAIRLAFDGGPTMKKAVDSWWTSFTNYLFGYTKTHPVFGPNGKFLGITRTSVDGALHPIVEWFGRQHFEKTGLKWADTILTGIKNSKFA